MHHPMFAHYAMLLIVRLSSLFVCFFSIRRRRWDRRGLREHLSGVSSAPGCWVCRQVFTHMNHCFRSSLVTDSSVVFLLALLFDACLDPNTCHPAAMNIALPPHLQPCCLLACVVVSCLGLFVLESCCPLSYHLCSILDGLVIINIMLMFGVIIIWW